MSKPKRFERARSSLHARCLQNAGYPVRKPVFKRIGPYSPLFMLASIRHRLDLTPERSERVLTLLTLAARGNVMRYGHFVTVRPAGDGSRVILELNSK